MNCFMDKEDKGDAGYSVVYACTHQENIAFFCDLPDALLQQRLDERSKMLCPSCQLEERYMLAATYAQKINLKTLFGSSEHRKLAEIVRYELLDLYMHEHAVQDQAAIVSVLNTSLYRQAPLWIDHRAARWDKNYRDELFTVLQRDVAQAYELREHQRIQEDQR